MEELAEVVQEFQASHLILNPQGGTSPESPEKSSPSLASDKIEYSSIHSRSIPVMNTSNSGNLFSSTTRRWKETGSRSSHLCKRVVF